VGSGHRIGLLELPFLAVGLTLNTMRPEIFTVGGPPSWLQALSVATLIPGVTIWLWSVVLILTKVPRHELITTGPFALVKHPLYTGVSLLVLPWVGFLFDSWLGVVLGAVLYAGSRVFAPAEEREVADSFGAAWEEYRDKVMIGWL